VELSIHCDDKPSPRGLVPPLNIDDPTHLVHIGKPTHLAVSAYGNRLAALVAYQKGGL
jgi:hypothetical protein